MRKNKICSSILPVFLIAALTLSLQALAGKLDKGDSSGQEVYDIVKIKSVSAFRNLNMPEVYFPHDQHTQVLGKAKKDCLECHLKKNNKLVYKFKKEKVADKQTAKKLYHSECIGCHKQRNEQGKRFGPLDSACRSCHIESFPKEPAYKPISFDKSLHYRHIKAQDKKCAECHHQPDEKERELIHKDKEELGCRACHMPGRSYEGLFSLASPIPETLFSSKISDLYRRNQTPMNLKQASHLACINCHLEQKPQDKDKGPVECKGCHSPQGQKKIKTLQDVPRLKRGQPNATLIVPAKQDLEPLISEDRTENLLPSVPFNHKVHEEQASTCRECHHESKLQNCSACHFMEGREKGGFVSLFASMHDKHSPYSCIGCHRSQTNNNQACSGCHTKMSQLRSIDTDDCRLCHTDKAPLAKNVFQMKSKAIEQSASRLIEAANETHPIYDLQEVPDKVVIKKIQDQYGPVELPHRKIIKKLYKNVKDSKLASRFHTSPGTLCQGCHHNSPPSKNPPQCSSCHYRPYKQGKTAKPGLKVAYHTLCMNCHTQMNIKEPANTACNKCHEKKKDIIIPD